MLPITRLSAVLGCCIALSSGPGWAICPFSFPIFQGGTSGQNEPTYLVLGVAPYTAVFFAQGQGEAAPGAGNDSGQILADPICTPGDFACPFLTQDAILLSDWTNAGVDGCPNDAGTAGEAVAASTVAFVTDSLGQYVVLGAAHWSQPVPNVDLDNIGRDQRFEALLLRPAIDIVGFGPNTVIADVLPARAAVNCYDDGSGICEDPDTIVMDPDTVLTLGVGGPPVPGCGVDGCAAVELPLDTDWCWDRGARIAGKVTYPGGVCSVAPLPCTSDADCALFTLGTCVVPPPVVEVFGEVPAGCIPDFRFLADEATNATASRVPGHVRFTWEVSEFDVVVMHVIAVGRAGERRLNDVPIFPRANDGSLQAYEVRIRNGAIRGDRDFRIRVIAADGTARDTPLALE